MKKLTQKTLLLLLGLSLIISILTYVCIWIFLPYVNKNKEQKELTQEAKQLITELRITPRQESELLFKNFIQKTGADIFLLDSEKNSISLFTFKKIKMDIGDGSSYPFRFANSKDEFILVVCYNNLRLNEIAKGVQHSIPFVVIIIIILSFISAWIFSLYTTRPIINIHRIADNISKLDFSWYCPDVSDDEIGNLSKSINELSDKLHEALDELYLRNDMLEDEILIEKERERRRMLFFSGVSHELKTPIAIVIGQLEGMQAGIGVYKDRDKYLARSTEILQSLNSFIREILLVSHIDISEQKESLLINISDIINLLANEYSAYAEEDGIEISIDITGDVLVYGDDMLLKKALGNIIGNAITHTPAKGSVRIELTRKNKTVDFNVFNSPAHIEMEHLSHLFEAFYRGNQNAEHGSGLGLYITKTILETYHIPHSIENMTDGVKFTVLFQEAFK